MKFWHWGFTVTHTLSQICIHLYTYYWFKCISVCLRFDGKIISLCTTVLVTFMPVFVVMHLQLFLFSCQSCCLAVQGSLLKSQSGSRLYFHIVLLSKIPNARYPCYVHKLFWAASVRCIRTIGQSLTTGRPQGVKRCSLSVAPLTAML